MLRRSVAAPAARATASRGRAGAGCAHGGCAEPTLGRHPPFSADSSGDGRGGAQVLRVVCRPGRRASGKAQSRAYCGTLRPGSAERPEGTAGRRVARPALWTPGSPAREGAGRPASWAPRVQGGADGPCASGTPRGQFPCAVASPGPGALPDPVRCCWGVVQTGLHGDWQTAGRDPA